MSDSDHGGEHDIDRGARDMSERSLVSGCRARQRQVLQHLEDTTDISLEELIDLVGETTCAIGHELTLAHLQGELAAPGRSGRLTMNAAGRAWLLEAGRPCPDWQASRSPNTPRLWSWQEEALRAWCEHGRQGVVEAVTGAGKSRVGVEAVREALADDYQALIVVPTVELVDQWVQALRRSSVPSVGVVGGGKRATLRTHRVLVGTVQSFFSDPPTRPDGKILLVADEVHRYGAEQWRRVLHPSYRRRLGLTATFERSDDGLVHLLTYFQGTPLFSIGFERAIADGVVAHYDVKLLGIDLTPRERRDYEVADNVAKDMRARLLSIGFPDTSFGAFMRAVQDVLKDPREDPTIVESARRYLHAFSTRIEIATTAQHKLTVMENLTELVRGAHGALVFTRRVDMAVELAATLQGADLKAEAIHSELTHTKRRELMGALRRRSLQALVAPTVLDEGVDVPDVDLAVVMGGSRSRRQMIQRMGRVLRRKPDGRKATFIVVYARRTIEDLKATDGVEGCLDLIVKTADSVVHLDPDVTTNAAVLVKPTAPAPARPKVTDVGSQTELAATEVPARPLLADFTSIILAAASPNMPVSKTALFQLSNAHGLSLPESEKEARTMLEAFLRESARNLSTTVPGGLVLSRSGFELTLVRGRVEQYASIRRDGSTWSDLVAMRTKQGGNSAFSGGAVDGGVSEASPTDGPENGASESVDSSAPAAAPGLVEQIERLARLHEQKLLSQEEFDRAKTLLLSNA